MAKKGIFRRFAERITTPVKQATTAVTGAAKKTTTAVKDVVTAPFVKKPKPAKKTKRPAPTPKVDLTRKRPRVPKPRPNPAVAREMLHAKLHDMWWLQKKWDAAAMTRRINRMTDDQVYTALEMSEDDVETAARVKPSASSQWADPDDPTKNVMWYHGGETMVG